MYPEEDWEFLRVPNGYWDDWNHVEAFWKKLGEKLEIREPSDWNRVLMSQIMQLGGCTIIQKYGGMYKILARCYPEMRLQLRHNTSVSLKSQQLLIDTVKQIGHDIQLMRSNAHSALSQPVSVS